MLGLRLTYKMFILMQQIILIWSTLTDHALHYNKFDVNVHRLMKGVMKFSLRRVCFVPVYV